LPQEDQGTILVNMQLPPGATLDRTQAVVEQVEDYLLKQPEVANMVAVMGFSFSGQGQNAALSFVSLKPWDERKGAEHGADAVAGRAMGALSGVKDAFIFSLSPPPWASVPASTCDCRTAAARAMTPCWPRATSCWA
jgi:multidrug efflux pump